MSIPNIKVAPPGAESQEWHARAIAHMKGHSTQVDPFPVVLRSRGSIGSKISFGTTDFQKGERAW